MEYVDEGICGYGWFSRIVYVRFWMVEEESAELVVYVGDGLSVATISCLMWG